MTTPPEVPKPDEKPMDAKQCVESADAVTGSLTIIRTMLRDAADKLDETIPRQSALSRNLTRLFKLDTAAIPRSAGMVTVAGLLLIFGIGVASMGTLTAKRHGEQADRVSGAALMMSRGDELLRQQKYKEAITWYMDAVKQGGDKESGLGGVAECYFHLGEYDNALATCDRLNKDVPNAGVAYHIRGITFIKQGNKQEGMQQLRLAARHGYKLANIILSKEK